MEGMITQNVESRVEHKVHLKFSLRKLGVSHRDSRVSLNFRMHSGVSMIEGGRSFDTSICRAARERLTA